MIYHVDYNIPYQSYRLTAYELKKETDKRYYVGKGTSIIGILDYRTFLEKNDSGVFTDFELAKAAMVTVLENFIKCNQDRITKMQKEIELIKYVKYE